MNKIIKNTDLYKQIFIVCFAFLLLATLPLKADSKDDGEVQTPCCYYIEISVEPDEDCCYRIIVNNPYCNGGVSIIFEQLIEGNWVVADIVNQPPGFTGIAWTKLCATKAGATSIEYRVKIAAGWNNSIPYCAPNWFDEGWTVYTGSIPINCCPCPAENDWLTLVVDRDDPECPGRCKVRHILNIPENVTCYKSVAIYNESYPDGVTFNLLDKPLSDFDFCIPYGSAYSADIYLLTDYNEDPFYHLENGCHISATVTCDSLKPDPKPTPCLPDCFDDVWEEPYLEDNFTLVQCAGCEIYVKYTWRHACGVWQDIQILEINLLGENCNTCSRETIYHEVLGAVIAYNAMGFEPQVGVTGCNTTWRVASGSCMAFWWRKTWDSQTGKIDSVQVWLPCDTSECCLQPIRVCRDGVTNLVTINVIGTGYIFGCYGQIQIHPQTFEEIPCQPICHWLESLNGQYPYIDTKGTVGELGRKPNQANDTKDKHIYQARAEHINELLRIWIQSNVSGTSRIVLYDLKGNIVNESSYSISSGMNSIDYSLNDLSNGVYIYNVIVDGILIVSDKLVIVR